MAGIRELLNKTPWLGWGVAGVLALVSALLIWRALNPNDPYSVDTLTEDVTIKCIETGDEWTIKRGRLEAILRQRPGMLDAGEGLINPNTGTPTGFPFSKKEWEATIERINSEKQAVIDKRSGGASGGGS